MRNDRFMSLETNRRCQLYARTMGCFALLLLLVWISDVFGVLGVSSNDTIMAEISGRRLAQPVKVVDTVGLEVMVVFLLLLLFGPSFSSIDC